MKKQQPVQKIQNPKYNSNGRRPTSTTKTTVSKNVSLESTEKQQINNKEWPSKQNTAKECHNIDNPSTSNTIVSTNVLTDSTGRKRGYSTEKERPNIENVAPECPSSENPSFKIALADDGSTSQEIKPGRLRDKSENLQQ